MGSISATGYAILGLIAAKEGSAYELVQRMKSNYRFFWPRAQSNFYSSLKLLVSAGLSVTTDEAKGERPRTVYRVTPAGIEALSEWLSSTAKPPSFEFEGLLRVAYADFGDKSALLKQLESVRENAEEALAVGAAIAKAYAAGTVELPERAHTSHLLWQFLWSQHKAMADWAKWAIREVEAWSNTKSNAATKAQAARFFLHAAAGSPDHSRSRKSPDVTKMGRRHRSV